MSNIFLNYDDVRHLVKILGKHVPDDTAFSRIQLISAGLRTNVGWLNSKLQSDDGGCGPGINLTQESYQNLCTAIQSQDLTALRHTDRLEVVARAFGWRADALMHHLKKETGNLGSNPSLRENIDYVGDFEKNVGTEHFQKWRTMLNKGPGLFVLTGKPGNGISRAWIASVLLLDPKATPDSNQRGLVGKRSINEQRVFGVSIRTREDLSQCIEAASTATVIAWHGGKSLADTEAQLADWAEADGRSLSSIKGMLHLEVHNRYSPRAYLKVDICDYAEREHNVFHTGVL